VYNRGRKKQKGREVVLITTPISEQTGANECGVVHCVWLLVSSCSSTGVFPLADCNKRNRKGQIHACIRTNEWIVLCVSSSNLNRMFLRLHLIVLPEAS